MTYYLLQSYFCGGSQCCGSKYPTYVRIKLDATDLEEAIEEVQSYWDSPVGVGLGEEQFIVEQTTEFSLKELQAKKLAEAVAKSSAEWAERQERRDREEFARLRKKFTPADS